MRPRRRSRAFAIALPLAALAAGALASAQPFAEVEDRRRAVGDWLVEHVGEEDGGRLVRMIRESGDYSVDYRIAFWRGNAGPVRGGSVLRLNGMCGGFESRPDPAADVPADEVRAELARHLASCGVGDEEAASTLEGLERAYALVSAWAGEAAAATAAEAAAVAEYGADPMADENMAMPADDNMVIDMNMTADANETGADEPQ